jgi:hypothetical protein
MHNYSRMLQYCATVLYSSSWYCTSFPFRHITIMHYNNSILQYCATVYSMLQYCDSPTVILTILRYNISILQYYYTSYSILQYWSSLQYNIILQYNRQYITILFTIFSIGIKYQLYSAFATIFKYCYHTILFTATVFYDTDVLQYITVLSSYNT